jgi:hypothetical protein
MVGDGILGLIWTMTFYFYGHKLWPATMDQYGSIWITVQQTPLVLSQHIKAK